MLPLAICRPFIAEEVFLHTTELQVNYSTPGLLGVSRRFLKFKNFLQISGSIFPLAELFSVLNNEMSVGPVW